MRVEEATAQTAAERKRERVRVSMRRHRATKEKIMHDLRAQVAYLESIQQLHTVPVDMTTLIECDERFGKLACTTQYLMHQNRVLEEALQRRHALNESILQRMPRMADIPPLMYDNMFIRSHVEALKAMHFVDPVPYYRDASKVHDGWKSQLTTDAPMVRYNTSKSAVPLGGHAPHAMMESLWALVCGGRAELLQASTVVGDHRFVRFVDKDTIVFELTTHEPLIPHPVKRMLVLHRHIDAASSAAVVTRLAFTKTDLTTYHTPRPYHANSVAFAPTDDHESGVDVSSQGSIFLEGVSHEYAKVIVDLNVVLMCRWETFLSKTINAINIGGA
ncbi:Aste57867_11531 [Aphanomyces stellatus]|uniref:Aste57867_11531 protein n=1 Tax=Aphanomyces stellatus TaxID=120398 RepID=A0A485KUD8_9STRA|nr:hypothetical protein As57867_011488 [Aphanomyces stellatus]VFT88392.1 Aste57867_11531 [Aphanomyces stellatus]